MPNSKKDMIELGVIGVGIIVFIFVLSGAFNRNSRNKVLKPESADSAVKVSAPRGEVSGKSRYTLLELEANALELKTDPFTGTTIAIMKKVSSGIALSGVLWNKSNPLALIDGKVMKKGDRVGDWVIVAINENSVILNDGYNDFILKVGQ